MAQLFNLRGLTFSGQLKSMDYNCTFFYACIICVCIYIYTHTYVYFKGMHSFNIETQLIYNIVLVSGV